MDYRGDTSIRREDRIYDLYYIESWTVGLDLKILFLTCFKGGVGVTVGMNLLTLKQYVTELKH
ncbi:MAG: hypothetical protein ACLR6B_16405, partial [Blautia sp.]